MGTIWYECASCEDECHPRDRLRVMPDGKWVCEVCFIDAPEWTYLPRPADASAEQPRWDTFPEVPEHKPERSLLNLIKDHWSRNERSEAVCPN
jgi:hypothetical protein